MRPKVLPLVYWKLADMCLWNVVETHERRMESIGDKFEICFADSVVGTQRNSTLKTWSFIEKNSTDGLSHHL